MKQKIINPKWFIENILKMTFFVQNLQATNEMTIEKPFKKKAKFYNDKLVSDEQK